MVGVEKLEARNQIDRKTIFKVITRKYTQFSERTDCSLKVHRTCKLPRTGKLFVIR